MYREYYNEIQSRLGERLRWCGVYCIAVIGIIDVFHCEVSPPSSIGGVTREERTCGTRTYILCFQRLFIMILLRFSGYWEFLEKSIKNLLIAIYLSENLNILMIIYFIF
jgi:hypothetical protein